MWGCIIGMSADDVLKLWDKEWTDFSNVHESGSPVGKWLHKQRMVIIRKMLLSINSDSTTIDIGCGGGETLKLLRDCGFKNSIGIDFSEHAIDKAKQFGFVKDKDIFLIDGKDTKYPNRHFKFVFSEGLWEHFEDPTPFMDEACRIADEWLMIIQPDHFSFFGGLLHWGWSKFSKKGVFEYSFKLEWFTSYVKNLGFDLYAKKSTLLNEQSVLLYRRKN